MIFKLPLPLLRTTIKSIINNKIAKNKKIDKFWFSIKSDPVLQTFPPTTFLSWGLEILNRKIKLRPRLKVVLLKLKLKGKLLLTKQT